MSRTIKPWPSMIKEMLELEGWNIESCADGVLALRKDHQ